MTWCLRLGRWSRTRSLQSTSRFALLVDRGYLFFFFPFLPFPHRRTIIMLKDKTDPLPPDQRCQVLEAINLPEGAAVRSTHCRVSVGDKWAQTIPVRASAGDGHAVWRQGFDLRCINTDAHYVTVECFAGSDGLVGRIFFPVSRLSDEVCDNPPFLKGGGSLYIPPSKKSFTPLS